MKKNGIYPIPKEFEKPLAEVDSKDAVTVKDFLALAKIASGLRRHYPRYGEGMLWQLFRIQSTHFWENIETPPKEKIPPESDDAISTLVDLYDLHPDEDDAIGWKYLEQVISRYEKSKTNP